VSFELPARQGRSKRPVPAISIGARKRGKYGKLTPYVLFTKEAAEAIYGSNRKLLITIGVGEDEGFIRIHPSSETAANVTLRRQSQVNEDLVVESTLIPHDGKTVLRRTEAEINIDPEDRVLQVKLPWHRKTKPVKKGL